VTGVGRRDFAGELLLAGALLLRFNVVHAVRAHRTARRLAMPLMHPWERDDVKRLAKLLLWLWPRDMVARALRSLANLVEVKPRR